jgi:hypothetical protein
MNTNTNEEQTVTFTSSNHYENWSVYCPRRHLMGNSEKLTFSTTDGEDISV